MSGSNDDGAWRMRKVVQPGAFRPPDLVTIGVLLAILAATLIGWQRVSDREDAESAMRALSDQNLRNQIVVNQKVIVDKVDAIQTELQTLREASEGAMAKKPAR